MEYPPSTLTDLFVMRYVVLAPELARCGIDTAINRAFTLRPPKLRFTATTTLNTDVCVFYLVPGFNDASISGYIAHHVKCQNETNAMATTITPSTQESPTSSLRRTSPIPIRAMVFALYGSGNAPARKRAFLTLIRQAIEVNIAVVITSQCTVVR